MATIKPMLCGNYDASKMKHSESWYISEKLDGWRMVYKDGMFYTRSGKPIVPPTSIREFVKNIPTDIILDGELWNGYDGFQSINEGNEDMEWVLFDIPSVDAPYHERYKTLTNMFKDSHVSNVRVLSQTLINRKEADEAYDRIMKEIPKAEGVVYRPADMKYLWDDRDPMFMKRKPFHDTEAIVTGYYTTPSALKTLGEDTKYVSSLKCVLAESGVQFRVSIKTCNPPAIGSVITIKYQALTEGGVPRFPIYKSVRNVSDMPLADKPKSVPKPQPQPEKVINIAEASVLKPGERVYVKASKGDTFYCIVQPKNPNAKPYCSCPGWKYQKLPAKDRICKHTVCFM